MKILLTLQLVFLALMTLILLVARNHPPNDLLAYITHLANQRWDIYLLDRATGSTARLQSGAMIRSAPLFWSRDCRHLAFVSTQDGNAEIYVTDTEEGISHNLTRNNADDRSPSWSPDGGQIAFESSRQIIVRDADGRNFQLLAMGAFGSKWPSWSPDGRQIAYASMRSSNNQLQIRLMNGDRNNDHILSSAAYALGLSSGPPQWSPDSRWIAVTGRLDNSTVFELLTLQAADGTLRRLTNGLPAASPTWSPDGRQIAFVSQLSSGSYDLYVVNADGSNLRNLTQNPGVSLANNPTIIVSSPTWSSDGKEIVFASGPDGSSELYTISPDSGPAQLIHSRHSGDKMFPTWCWG